MTPARILITGATGFVGPYVQAACAREFAGAEIIKASADITDRAAVNAMIAAVLPDVVIHLAGIASVPVARSDPTRAFAVNFTGTLNLAYALLESRPGALLINAGSSDCYGASFRPGTPLDETAALAPLNTYAASKAAADLTLGALAAEAGLRLVRLRSFNHTGPGQSDAYVIPAFAAQVASIKAGSQKPVINVGNLTAERDFLDVRDIAAAFASVITHAEALEPGCVFNLASGTTRRVGDILNMLIAASGLDIEVKPDPERMRPVDIPRASGNAAKAQRLLGWAPAIPFETTLSDVLASFQPA
jgi:GDP-4-dehydro-6-deoxy-D-mannose reductase